MDRYCVEVDEHGENCVLHQDSCTAFSHAQLLSTGRLFHFGDFATAGEAFGKAGSEYRNLRICSACCRPAADRKASVNALPPYRVGAR